MPCTSPPSSATVITVTPVAKLPMACRNCSRVTAEGMIAGNLHDALETIDSSAFRPAADEAARELFPGVGFRICWRCYDFDGCSRIRPRACPPTQDQGLHWRCSLTGHRFPLLAVSLLARGAGSQQVFCGARAEKFRSGLWYLDARSAVAAAPGEI